MQPLWMDNLTTWIAAHPVAAGMVAFLIGFCDALAVVGIVVPALPLLFAVGTLVGLGHINGPYALVCTALGAFCGDALSYWIGQRWGVHMRELWLFRRYPQFITRSETLFRRNPAKSILIARFIGAIRPFVPAVAGMLHMPLRRYLPVSAVACLGWAALFLAPGWIFGTSFDAVAAVADRLALVLLGVVVMLAAAWAAVIYTWRWFALHADDLLQQLLAWSRAHPRLARVAAAVTDPQRQHPSSLLLLAVCVLLLGWGTFQLLASLWMQGGPLALDRHLHGVMFALRNPLADRLMATLATLGDPMVLLPAMGVGLLYLAWRRRWIAVAYWLAALAFGFALTTLLEALIHMPRPPTAVPGFGFPAVGVTMITIVFGFFAVLIARELPGRRRIWPYMVAMLLACLLGFARLYFGAHWLSDIVGGLLFGGLWVFVLGIAYRRHTQRSFFMRPVAFLFYATFVASAAWHGMRVGPTLLERFAPPVQQHATTIDGWWERDWRLFPTQRAMLARTTPGKLDVQIAGSLDVLERHLLREGWRLQPQADWLDVLTLLDADTGPRAQAVLPAALETRPEARLYRRDSADGLHVQVLRVWPSPLQPADGMPLWLAQSQALAYRRPLGWFGLWIPEPDDGRTHAAVKQAVSDMAMRDVGDGRLLLRTDR